MANVGGFCGLCTKRVDAYDYFKEEVEKQQKLLQETEEKHKNVNIGIGFVIFKSMKLAAQFKKSKWIY